MINICYIYNNNRISNILQQRVIRWQYKFKSKFYYPPSIIGFQNVFTGKLPEHMPLTCAIIICKFFLEWLDHFKKKKKISCKKFVIYLSTYTCKLLTTLWFKSVSSFLVSSTNSPFGLNCILPVPVYFFLRYLLFSTIDVVNQKDLVVYSTTNF